MQRYTDVDAEQVAALLDGEDVFVLDVRSPEEYRELGHLPGAALCPLQLVTSALASVPRDKKRLLLVCEHGVRSVHAAEIFAAAGFDGLLNFAGGMSVWTGPRSHEAGDAAFPIGPSDWLLECADLIPAGGNVVDVASGRGRHALLLAAAGFEVEAIDRDEEALAWLEGVARGLRLTLSTSVFDLESASEDALAETLGEGTRDAVLVVHYLYRQVFPALVRSLAPGGVLLYETFTRQQGEIGRPKNPDFLLGEGELPRLLSDLQVVRKREGHIRGRYIASAAAIRPR